MLMPMFFPSRNDAAGACEGPIVCETHYSEMLFHEGAVHRGRGSRRLVLGDSLPVLARRPAREKGGATWEDGTGVSHQRPAL